MVGQQYDPANRSWVSLVDNGELARLELGERAAAMLWDKPAEAGGMVACLTCGSASRWNCDNPGCVANPTMSEGQRVGYLAAAEIARRARAERAMLARKYSVSMEGAFG